MEQGTTDGRAPEEMMGCTVGVIRVSGGILVFKNRDLGKDFQTDNVTVFHSTPDVRTLKGVNIVTKGLEGVSIGVNRRKVCVANTHVASIEGVPYDVLCERFVHEAGRKADVAKIAGKFMKENIVQGGRILVASPKWAFLVEVFGKRLEIEEVRDTFVMTNSFSLISHEKEGLNAPGSSSSTRLNTAREMAKGIQDVGALRAMLRSHVPEKGPLSICNHGGSGGTESSHIIQIRGDYIGWSSLVGYPCENDYHTIQLFQG